MDRRHHHGTSPYEAAYGFARAIRDGEVIRVAGTAPLPAPGSDVAPDAYGQMLRCGEIVSEALSALGGSMADAVRTRMFIVDPDDADAVGRAHRKLFAEAEPVATMVVVAALLDPEWKVEIEVEAVVR